MLTFNIIVGYRIIISVSVKIAQPDHIIQIVIVMMETETNTKTKTLISARQSYTFLFNRATSKYSFIF